jgi:hypothetical protein
MLFSESPMISLLNSHLANLAAEHTLSLGKRVVT